MIRAGLNMLAAVVLLFAQVQCAMACTGELPADASSRQALPPCHRHHNQSQPDDPSACVHKTLSAPAIQTQAMHLQAPHLTAAILPPDPASLAATDTPPGTRYGSNFSPPGIGIASPPVSVLRV